MTWTGWGCPSRRPRAARWPLSSPPAICDDKMILRWDVHMLIAYSRCSSHRITQASSPALALRKSMNCVGKVGLCLSRGLLMMSATMWCPYCLATWKRSFQLTWQCFWLAFKRLLIGWQLTLTMSAVLSSESVSLVSAPAWTRSSATFNY